MTHRRVTEVVNVAQGGSCEYFRGKLTCRVGGLSKQWRNGTTTTLFGMGYGSGQWDLESNADVVDDTISMPGI